MNCLFIKRDTFKNKEGTKEYYIIVCLIGKVIATSFVDKATFDWFSVAECGDEIPTDFTKVDLYESNKGLSARVTIRVNNKK